jgi:copper chaperone CopZ
MTHTYNVKGMTCGGCKSSVEKYLSQIENVTKVVADVQKGEAEVTMSSHVDTETLKKSLPKNFILTEKMESPTS